MLFVCLFFRFGKCTWALLAGVFGWQPGFEDWLHTARCRFTINMQRVWTIRTNAGWLPSLHSVKMEIYVATGHSTQRKSLGLSAWIRGWIHYLALEFFLVLYVMRYWWNSNSITTIIENQTIPFKIAQIMGWQIIPNVHYSRAPVTLHYVQEQKRNASSTTVTETEYIPLRLHGCFG